MKQRQHKPDRGSRPDITPEERSAILQLRAKELAKGTEGEVDAGEYLETLEFLLARETYAVDTIFVREVCPMIEVTPLPCTPAFIFGLINIRGQILTVVDMKRFFDLQERGITNLNKVIVLARHGVELGILADEIIGIRNVRVNEIHPPPSAMTGIHPEYLKGITGDGLIIIDTDRFLSDGGLIVNDEVDA